MFNVYELFLVVLNYEYKFRDTLINLESINSWSKWSYYV